MIRIHVMHTGFVRVSPYLPYGGDDCNILKASGLFIPDSRRLWLPVSVYLIEHPKGLILVDTGWNREMSPDGVFDRKAQIRSLGSWPLYRVNQGMVGPGQTVDEQLAQMGIRPKDLDYLLLTHLDCDHANGLEQVKEAKKILVSKEEIICARKHGAVRYQKKWWKDVDLQTFNWNGNEGPVGHSFELFGDGSVVMVHIPGHSDGQVAVKVTGDDGRFVLLFADGGYSSKSWQEMILPGISCNKKEELKSLLWIKSQCEDEHCLEGMANHDPDIIPHTICL